MLYSLNVQEHHVTGTSALDIEMQELWKPLYISLGPVLLPYRTNGEGGDARLVQTFLRKTF